MRTRPVLALVWSVSWAIPVLAQTPAGDEFRVNTYTTSSQEDPALAADRHGNFVVAWESNRQDGLFGSAVVARRYDAAGVPQGSEFIVNTYTTGYQRFPSVGRAPDGSFVVVWTSFGQDGSAGGIFGQVFDGLGGPRGAEFRVNTYTTGDQRQPSVAMSPNGQFAVVWASDGQDGSFAGVFGQRFDPTGVPQGSEFRVNTHTTFNQRYGAVTMAPGGGFVVVWESEFQDGYGTGILAQRYDPAGAPVGAEFQVNTYTTSSQDFPSITSDAAGNFVVVWNSTAQDGSSTGVFGQRYDSSGVRRGGEFKVNTYTTGLQFVTSTSVASDAHGGFVVSWYSDGQDGSGFGIFGQRFAASGAPRGAEFAVNTYTTGIQFAPPLASDAIGNVLIAWNSLGQDGSAAGVFARRFGGLVPAGMSITDGANGVLEVPEDFALVTSWRNVSGAARSFQGRFSDPVVPAGLVLTLSADANYGTVADGAVGSCIGPCFAGFLGGTRPAGHVDFSFVETIVPDTLGQTKRWSVHVGDSFTDVPRASPFYRFVETLLHRGVTGGCAATTYCPTASATREQMAPFVLLAREGAGYAPPACATPMFADVPASSPFCRWIEELARRGVVSGCGGGNYCPTAAVTREQMAVFVLRTLDPALAPPACTTPVFADVPASSPYCRWIEELARRGVVTGCGGGNYCPAAPVTREQMAVFLTVTFGLTLYGP